MKKLVLFFAVFFLAVSAYAIDLKTGSFAALAGQERVRVDFDFSDVMIDGKYIINYSLVDNATGEVLGTAYQTGDGGTFGSFSNLQGDGFEEAAEAFKKFLNKQLKPEK